MSNYTATVVKIDNIRDHSNADRLSCTNLFGNNVIISKDTQIGDIGLFFPLESQLSEEFATANDLIRRKDENGNVVGGMFEQNRRVKACTLRGEKSMGFYAPISSLEKVFADANKEMPIVKIGQEFEEIDGVKICCKYIIPTKKQQCSTAKSKKSKKPRESRIIEGQFAFHFDTAQLAKNLHKVKLDSLVAITWKMHGTSAIFSNCLVKKKLGWYEKILKAFGVNIIDTEYDHIFSSRKVIKNGLVGCEGFYGEDIWSDAGKHFVNRLHKGETVYAEIVGYTPGGKMIQKDFDYGCKPGEYKIYIYRITQTNMDGVVTELPWHQVVHRAIEIGFEATPTIYYGKVKDHFNMLDCNSMENYFELLQNHYVYDQDSQFCKNKVPEEGIVVRIELGDGIENLKLKSFAFLGHESKMLDSGEADMESEESEE